MIQPAKCNTPEMTLIYKIHGLVMCLDKEADHHLQNLLSISYNQFLILFVISQKSANTQKRVAFFSNLTEAAVSKQIETLRKKGYLTREENRKDRREHVLKLTSEGENTLQLAMDCLHENTNGFISVLSPEELTNINIYLKKLFNSASKNFKTIKEANI